MFPLSRHTPYSLTTGPLCQKWTQFLVSLDNSVGAIIVYESNHKKIILAVGANKP